MVRCALIKLSVQSNSMLVARPTGMSGVLTTFQHRLCTLSPLHSSVHSPVTTRSRADSGGKALNGRSAVVFSVMISISPRRRGHCCPTSRSSPLKTLALSSRRMHTLTQGTSRIVFCRGTTFLAWISLKRTCHVSTSPRRKAADAGDERTGSSDMSQGCNGQAIHHREASCVGGSIIFQGRVRMRVRFISHVQLRCYLALLGPE